MNTFEFIGTIVPCKATEKFQPFETKTFDSGWSNKTIKFSVACGTNRHMVQASALFPKKIENSTINTFSKGYTDDSGNKVKGKKMEVDWSDRFNKNTLEMVADFKKCVIDTIKESHRWALKNILDGSANDSDYELLGIASEEEANELNEKWSKNKKEFISEYDFVDAIQKLLASDEIKNWKFKVRGTHEFQYSSKTGKWYNNYVVHKITRVEDDAKPVSKANYNLYFNKESVNAESFDETKKITVNGWVQQYVTDKAYKKNCFAPFPVSLVGDNAKKIANKIFSFADSEAEYREIGVICDVLNGSQKIEFTEDMLTDEQREDIELGWITIEDIKRDMNKDLYGEKITDVRIVKPMRGYTSGAIDTAYTEKDFSMATEIDVVEDIFDMSDILADDEDDI